jgi:hypothetical protein
MGPLSHTVVAAFFIVVAAITTGCNSTRRPAPPAPSDGHRTIAQGYSLLHAITSEQKELKKLLLVKVESDSVDAVISELADYTGKLSAELEDMARRYPALTVDTQFLPEVEVKARESITSDTTRIFLDTKGKEFERRLLLKQLSALEQERHIAKVMVALETADERRAFWTRTEQRFGELYAKVEQLLERQYFCD